jgi:murein DD-endopeptidase MepM/ murein hydrolase activator NlpD
MRRSWNKVKPKGAVGAASWGSLALAAVFGAFASFELGSQSAPFTGASVVPIAIDAEQAVALQLPSEQESALAAVAFTPEIVAPAPVEVRITTEGELRRGETLAASLDRQGIGSALVHEIATSMRPVFDFRYSRAGDSYRLEQNEAGRVIGFDYQRSALMRYTLRREGEALVPERIEPDLTVERARLAGVVTTSLYNAIQALGESGDLAHDFAEIFAWDVDFSRSVHPGDEFHILYERRFLRDAEGRERYVGPGRILAARYASASASVDHSAIYFEQEEGRAGYYRPDGSAVERQFLKAPLTYRRISSSYSTGRLHPILGRRRPHLGTDYAAATGTPVWSVGEGRVTHRGWLGGLGKTVKVRHANGFESTYGHLSRYPNLRIGQRVRQKQVIGYVGSTGLSTGPHLHFVMKKSGRHVNPSTIKTEAAAPIPSQKMNEFAASRDELLTAMDPSALRFVTNEAL